MMMLMLERGMDPPHMSPTPAAFFDSTSESLEPQSSFIPQPGDNDIEADIEATVAAEEDEEADDDEKGDDLDDIDDLDD